MPWPAKEEPLTAERVERALIDAENRDPEALRAILARAPAWHTPLRNLVGGDHLGQEQAVRHVRDLREMTGGTFHVEEIAKPQMRGDTGTLRLRTTASRGGLKLDTEMRLRFRIENGRVAEIWTEPASVAAWDAFFAP